MAENPEFKNKDKDFLKQKFNFLLGFLFPKNIFLSLLSGLVWAGLFSVVIYTFATPPTSPYTLGETLNPSCAPGSTNCTVTEPAAYSFSSNDFSGTGGFTTTGTVSGGTITDGTISIASGSITSGVDATFSGTGSFGSLVLTTSALAVGYGGTGVTSIASGSVLAANAANTLTAINSTSGTKYLQNVDGTISWGIISSDSYVPYTGAAENVNLGAYTIQADNFISSDGTAGASTTTGGLTFKDGLYTAGTATSVSFGTTTQIPYMNAGGTDFLYSAGFVFDGTNLSVAKIIGGSETTSDLSLQTTSGIGTTGADMHFLVGNNGATEAMTILNSGNLGIGTTDPSQELDVVGDIELEDTTSDDTGVIYKGANRFIHNYQNPAVLLGDNTFIGENAGNFTMGSTATEIFHASYNVGAGSYTLFYNTTGYSNTANGSYALFSNTTGYNNTAMGVDALYSNTTGAENTANGMYTLYSNKAGSNGVAIGASSQQYANDTAVAWTNYNTSVGYQALMGSTTAANNTGNYNTALGYQAMKDNTSGAGNVAIGYVALENNTTGSSSLAIGSGALYANTVGGSNIAFGNNVLYSNISGSNGVAIGIESQRYVNDTATPWTNSNTSIGYQALRGSATPANNTGNSNTTVGYQSLYSNTSGYSNSAFGKYSLNSNTTGFSNSTYGINSCGLNISGAYNVALGELTLFSNKTGSQSVAIGYQSQYYANDTLVAFTSYNTAVGYQALRGSATPANNTGVGNTAVGHTALVGITTGSNLVAIGTQSLMNNTTGTSNTAVGSASSFGNITGSNNISVGVLSLYTNKAGSNGVAIGNESQRYVNDTATPWTNRNTSVGYYSLRGSTTAANNTGNYNTATGYFALSVNTTGNYNSAFGDNSLSSNTTGSNNSGFGMYALNTNTTGTYNTALGYQAGRYITGGETANTTSDYSVYLGVSTKASADNAQNEIVIGYDATGAGSNTITLGNTSMTKTVLPADNNKLLFGSVQNASIYHDGTNMYFNSQEAGAGNFIFSGGNVGIGASTTPTNAKLFVNGGIAVGADALNNTISTGSLGDGTTTLYVGTYTIDTTGPSDIITKEDIADTKYGLKDLLKLTTKDYKYKKRYVNEGETQKEHTGLIAQDVEQIYPEAVIHRTDGLIAVDYTKLVPLIIKSIQELSAGKTLSDSGTWGEGQVSSVNDSSFMTQLKSAFTTLGVYIENGIATFEEVVAQKATIRTAKVEGLEMVDKTTGEIWCAQINNGEWTKTKGECNISGITTAAQTETQPIETETPITETTTDVQTETQAESSVISSEEIVEEVKEEVTQQVAEQIKDQVVQEVTEQVTEQITEAVQQATEQSNEAKNSANEAQQSAKESQKHAEQAQHAAEQSTKQQAEESAESIETVETTDTTESTEAIEVELVEEPVAEQSQEEPQPSAGDLIQETTAGLFSGVMNFIKWLFGSATQTVSKIIPGDVKQSTASLSSAFTDNFMQGIEQIIRDVKSFFN